MAHKIFSILEILELILLLTETRTLLLSHSSPVQSALFFKPSQHKDKNRISLYPDQDPGQKRTRNPFFFENTLWSEFLRKQLPTSPRRYKCFYKLDFPVLDLAPGTGVSETRGELEADAVLAASVFLHWYC